MLLPKAIISQAAYDTRRNELDAAVASLQSAEAQLRQAVNAVSYATLKADRAGIVTAVSAEPGQVVSAGQPIVTVADAGETEIALAVPEQDAGRLAIGQGAKVTLWAGPRLSVDGRVREIGWPGGSGLAHLSRAHCRCRAARGHALRDDGDRGPAPRG